MNSSLSNATSATSKRFKAGDHRRINFKSLPNPNAENLDDPAIQAFFEGSTPQEILTWAIDHWGDQLALVTSFQASGMVLLDMAWRIHPKIRVITLDTGRLPQETYRFIERVRDRYDLDVEIFFPDMHLVQQMVHQSGPDLFYQSIENRQQCCHVRKVEPLQRALQGTTSWITGLRRDQNSNRASIRKIDVDPKSQERFKLSPLADWKEERVWSYLKTNNVPIHPLYGGGYTSIGCAPCTRATREGEDPRAGRWWWEAGGKSECGLHLASARKNIRPQSLPIVNSGQRNLVRITRQAS